MTEHNSYRLAIGFLFDLRWFGAKLGLENTRRLAELAGNPQDRLRFIHVAGTNGKGSTCAMLESIYRAAGLRVGLFTSPHLVSFRERIQVNRQPIAETDVVRLIETMRPWLKQFPEPHCPTFFEVTAVMALSYFAAQQCDLVVWETGLGGRLDATNIVTPVASVITNVQFDHQQWLGKTLAEISGEKAGIIKEGVPVLTAADEPAALEVIERVARERKAPLTRVAGGTGLSEVPALPLPGEHQKLNAALALAVVRTLQNQFEIPEAAVRAGLATVNWPGRFQLITRPSGQRIVMDGAHNVAGAEALTAAYTAQFPSERPTLILGVLDDKDWTGMCGILSRLAGRILTVPVNSERTAAPAELAEICRRANPGVPVTAHTSLAAALADAAPDPCVVIAGSLYLIGEATERLELLPAPAQDERGLNEWSGQSIEPARKS